MKMRSVLLVVFSVLSAHSAFGAATSCTNRPTVSDGSGGFFTRFDCTFFREPVYPFDLTPYITYDVPSFVAENYLVPGYVVFTTDSTDVLNQTLTDPAAFKDVLSFNPNQLAGTASSQVT